MLYGKEDYQADLKNPEMPHIKDDERFAAFYDTLGKEAIQLAQKYIPERTDWITPTEGGTILELGCHAGFNLIHWAKNDQLSYSMGVDISKPLLEHAEEEAKKAGVWERVDWWCGRIEDFDYPEYFTDIVLTETLEHVQEVLPVLQKAVHYLDNGPDEARLWISAPATRVGTYSHVRGINEEEMAAYLKQCGVDDEQVLWIACLCIGDDRQTKCVIKKKV